MSLKQALHDFFYKAVYDAADTKVGCAALSLMRPVFARVCPPENVGRTPAQVLAELGFDPSVFDHITDQPVKVLRRDLPSMLAFSALLENDQDLIQGAFSKHGDAVAFHGDEKSGSKTRFLILHDKRDYVSTLGTLAAMPDKFLTGVKGNSNLAQALTLGHEMAHFELPATSKSRAGQMVSIESSCDFWPAYMFRKAAEPTQFQDTYNDLMHARAVGPILVYLNDLEEKDASIFGHATALALAHPELFDDYDAMGDTVVNAYSEACEIIKKHIDWESFEPRMFQCYKAAKLALEHEQFDNIWAERAISIFVDGMDYLAPELVEQIMCAPKARNALVLDAA